MTANSRIDQIGVASFAIVTLITLLILARRRVRSVTRCFLTAPGPVRRADLPLEVPLAMGARFSPAGDATHAAGNRFPDDVCRELGSAQRRIVEIQRRPAIFGTSDTSQHLFTKARALFFPYLP